MANLPVYYMSLNKMPVGMRTGALVEISCETKAIQKVAFNEVE